MSDKSQLINMKYFITNKTLQTWSRKIHIYSSVSLLVSMLFFAITGLTLNRPELYVSDPQVKECAVPVPSEILHTLQADQKQFETDIVTWSQQTANLRGIQSPVSSYIRFDNDELIEGEIEFDYKSAGYDASVFVDLHESIAEFRVTDYGTVAWLNDLHKGRNTGSAWHWFIDIASIVMVLFVITGLIILFPKKKTLGTATKWLSFGTGITVLSYFLSY